MLERPCPECGFEASAFAVEDVGRLLRENATAWQAVLAPRGGTDEGHDGRLRRRPSDDRWSTLEYACHVRDVFRLYLERLQLMLTHDGPGFAKWDQDETAVADRYAEQDPATVSGELVAAAHALADAFHRVRPEDWQRTGTRSDGAHFTIESFARYLVHDPVHHLHDVTSAGAG